MHRRYDISANLVLPPKKSQKAVDRNVDEDDAKRTCIDRLKDPSCHAEVPITTVGTDRREGKGCSAVVVRHFAGR